MNILFVGNLNPDGRTFQRRRALEELGHHVTALTTVPTNQTFFDKGSIPYRVSWKLGLPLDRTGANRKIRQEVMRNSYDLVWIEKGNTVRPGTLQYVHRTARGMPIVSYTEDDMFNRHNRSLYYTRGLPYYDVVFTTKSYNANPEELPALGARRVEFVDKAYDRHVHRPVKITQADVTAVGGDVGFIGSYAAERAAGMLYLARSGIRVRVFGGGSWEKMAGSHPNLVIEGQPLYSDDYAKGLCATRINLCFLRKMNRDMQTDRTMEIPACGAFMLAERTDEHLWLFEEGQEAAYFDSDEELLEKVRYYLDHDDERAAIARAGRQRCLKSGYSHHERLEFMLEKAAHARR